MSKHYSIQCPNCAAPLDVLGGGRVNTITCAYCHSVLDLNDEYKVLAKFNNTKKPDAPFEIGMRGNIKGVEWTIIGWIIYKTGEFPSEEWSEFFLYSPTHGYAWLVYENGKLSFSKRVRDFDIYTWQEKKPKTIFYNKGHYMQNDSSYLTYIEYVAGELNWVAKFGDKFEVWDYSGVRQQELSIEKTKDEIEVYHTQKLNKADIYQSFGLEYTHKSKTKADNDSYEDDYTYDNDEEKYRKFFPILFSILAFVAFSLSFYEKKILHVPLTSNYESNITIDDNAFLTAIKIKGIKNNQENLKILLYDKDKVIFEMDKTKAIYPNKIVKPSWSYNTDSATAYIKLDKGTYRIVVTKSNIHNVIVLDIMQTVVRLKYLISVLIFIVLAIVYFYFRNLIKFAIAIAAIIQWGMTAFAILVFIVYIYNIYKDNND
jgi:hypothetical protein